MNPEVKLECSTSGGIPLLACIPVRSQPCPLVFAIPGYGGTKTSLLPLAYRLAQRGLACISFDPLYHGERGDERQKNAADPALGGIYPPETGMDIFRVFLLVIRQCSLDIQSLLPILSGDARLDITRAGVTGFSMGAYASYLALAEIPTLRAGVAMMGLPTFSRRWQDLLDECALSNPAWATALQKVAAQTVQTIAWIRGFDPAERLKKAAPRALLAMNGDMDFDQPKYYVLDWLRTVRPAYAACPENLRWNVYPVGHTLTPQMEQDAVDWFVRHLA
jgi:dienelactone hydrolase